MKDTKSRLVLDGVAYKPFDWLQLIMAFLVIMFFAGYVYFRTKSHKPPEPVDMAPSLLHDSPDSKVKVSFG